MSRKWRVRNDRLCGPLYPQLSTGQSDRWGDRLRSTASTRGRAVPLSRAATRAHARFARHRELAPVAPPWPANGRAGGNHDRDECERGGETRRDVLRLEEKLIARRASREVSRRQNRPDHGRRAAKARFEILVFDACGYRGRRLGGAIARPFILRSGEPNDIARDLVRSLQQPP